MNNTLNHDIEKESLTSEWSECVCILLRLFLLAVGFSCEFIFWPSWPSIVSVISLFVIMPRFFISFSSPGKGSKLGVPYFRKSLSTKYLLSPKATSSSFEVVLKIYCTCRCACQDAARWLDTLRLLPVSAGSSVSSPIAAVTSDDGCCAKATHNMRNKHVKERAKAMLNGLAMLTFWSRSLCNQASSSGSW